MSQLPAQMPAKKARSAKGAHGGATQYQTVMFGKGFQTHGGLTQKKAPAASKPISKMAPPGKHTGLPPRAPFKKLGGPQKA